MSWDIVLERNQEELGSLSDVLQKMKAAVPAMTFSDFERYACGFLNEKDFRLEFSLTKGEPVKMIVLMIRGDEAVLPTIERICAALNCKAFDLRGGDYLEFPARP